MSKAVKVKDLKDQIGEKFPRPELLCRLCGALYSANAGDYFNAKPDTIFKHCGRNMELVIKRVVFEPVQR